MMRGIRSVMVVGVAIVGVLAMARLSIHAQERKPGTSAPGIRKGAAVLTEKSESSKGFPARDGEASVSVVDALERPFILPFGEPTRLDEVCSHLRRILNAPVVLDRAAMDRMDVRPDDTIEIELHGVRLKTGLRLLLDQVGLTYRVVPEDNLLILTDRQGAEDPLSQVLAELKSIHRDLHTLQTSVDEVRTALGLDDDGLRMHKPTIIEEMPGEPAEKKPAPAPANPAPRPRSGM